MHRLRGDDEPADAEARVSRPAASRLGGALGVGGTLDAVVAATRDALGADRATLYTVAPDSRIAGVHTTETDPAKRARLDALVGLSPERLPFWEAMLASEDPVLAIPDTEASARLDPEPAAVRPGAGLAVRLQLAEDGGAPAATELGCLTATWRAPRPIAAPERRIAAALGGLATTTLRVAHLRAETAELLHAARGREEVLARAQRMARLGGWTWHVTDGRVEWSEEAYRVVGVAPGRPADLATFLGCVHPDDREAVAAHCREIVPTARPYDQRYRVVHPGGEVRVIAGFGEADRVDADGRALRYVGTMQDVTAMARAQERVALQARLLDAVDAAVIATDLDGTVTHWNRAAEAMYGWSRDEAVGRPIVALTVGPIDAAVARATMDCLTAEGHWEGELTVRRKDGTVFPAYVRGALMPGAAGAPVGVVGVSVDISARVEMEGRLRTARDFLATVTESMGDGLITLDAAGRFTYLNPAAEQMLGWSSAEAAGRRMHETVHHRRPDGRPHPAEECRLLRPRPDGEVVRVDDEMFVRRDERDLFVSCTSVPFTSEEGGRGWVMVFSDATERRRREDALRRDLEAATWVGSIRDALAHDGFLLHAQPIIELASGRVVQHELLLRMRSAGGEVVPPGRFLPSAERHGLIGDIDRWVVRRSAEMAAAGHPVELNLSAQSIGAPGFAAVVEDALERAGADPRRIVIELTETALLRSMSAAAAFIEHMKEIGCGVALDDFGTGYGGFRYLTRLPVDLLKIDVEFVRDLSDNPASRHVVEAVVSLARAFGLRTIAEGVERIGTLALLEEMGVDMAQGYAISRPRPVARAFAPDRIQGAERRARRGLGRAD